MNTTMADGARERLVAQIGEALFGQPGLTLMELAEKVKEARDAKPFPWENFPAYLLDKCEGSIIYEETLQQALADMAKDERYCRPSVIASQPSPAGQGDVRSLAEHITDHLCDHEYDIGGRPELLACVVDALAARQPVGPAVKDSLTVGGGQAVAWQTMASCPRDGTAILLRWGEDHVSPGWWCADVSPIQNEDGTWPRETGGFPWAFFDMNDGMAFVNHAADTEYGPTHWAPYVYPPAQAVDLGRVRASIQSLLNWIDDWAETPEESGIDAIEAEAEAVLALIDSKVVGNG